MSNAINVLTATAGGAFLQSWLSNDFVRTKCNTAAVGSHHKSRQNKYIFGLTYCMHIVKFTSFWSLKCIRNKWIQYVYYDFSRDDSFITYQNIFVFDKISNGRVEPNTKQDRYYNDCYAIHSTT